MLLHTVENKKNPNTKVLICFSLVYVCVNVSTCVSQYLEMGRMPRLL